MKKLSLAAIAVLITTIAGAQIQFGVKAGLNLAKLHESPAESDVSLSMKTSFHAGALVYLPLFSHFGLQPEVLYSGQGSKLKSDNTNYDYTTGSINVPVLFKYKDPSGFFAEVGPQIGFLLSAKIKSGSQSADAKEFFKSTDIAGAFGIGYLSPFNLGIDARYVLGLTNVAKEATDGTKIKNNVIQIGLFYVFGGKK